MDIFLDCLPCFLRQVLEASKMATDQSDLYEKIMNETIELISDYRKFRYSPEIGRDMHRLVKKYTGISDPYEKIKRENISEALKIYPLLKNVLAKKSEKLYWALKIAAAGNIIDSAMYKDINIEECIEREVEKEFSICDIEVLERKLNQASSLLIIGDNAGETVFDRILAEELINLDITYAVRSEPIINDATIEDALASGRDECTRIISTGCGAPGLILEECSDTFLKVFEKADIVISKGQGNYECLSESKANRDIFFLLKAKCHVISDYIGVNQGDYIFKWNSTSI